jgi:hypothetical protein
LLLLLLLLLHCCAHTPASGGCLIWSVCAWCACWVGVFVNSKRLTLARS